jgi:hypothetical protein
MYVLTCGFWYAGLLFAAGAAAWSLPLLFLVFTAVCMPWRAVSFYRQKWVSKQRTDKSLCSATQHRPATCRACLAA